VGELSSVGTQYKHQSSSYQVLVASRCAESLKDSLWWSEGYSRPPISLGELFVDRATANVDRVSLIESNYLYLGTAL
jgi:hypothetical protein